MRNTIGHMNWGACGTCKHSGREGGCRLSVPDSLDDMTLAWDDIECNKFEEL